MNFRPHMKALDDPNDFGELVLEAPVLQAPNLMSDKTQRRDFLVTSGSFAAWLASQSAAMVAANEGFATL